MAGRGVHEARAGVLGHMLAVEQRHFEIVAALVQRMRGDEALGLDLFDKLPFLHARGLEERVRQRFRQDVTLAGLGPVVLGRLRDLVQAVGDLA